MNGRDTATVLERQSSADMPGTHSIWRTDFRETEPAALRAARYAIQLFKEDKQFVEDSEGRRGIFEPLWKLLAPLRDNAAANTACAIVLSESLGKSQSDVLSQWKMSELSNMPDETWLRLISADGTAPTIPCITLLAKLFELSNAELRVLNFLVTRIYVAEFKELLDRTDRVHFLTNLRRLAVMLDLDTASLRSILSKKSSLCSMRLVQVSKHGHSDLEGFLQPGDGLAEIVHACPTSEQELMDLLIDSAPAPELALDDFQHLDSSARHVCTVLKTAATRCELGVNALFFGPPGTGKTQFAQAVARAIGLKLYRVRSDDDDGESVGRSGRLLAYLIAQRLLARCDDALILFDEVEDVFADGASTLAQLLGNDGENAGKAKGWMNRTLEENPVPAIWITNDAASMDAAFLRRFLLPVEFTTPPRSVRRTIIERHLGKSQLPSAFLDQLAADDKLAPAQFGAAARLLRLHDDGDIAISAEQVVREGIESMRRLLHGSGLPSMRQSATAFDPSFMNIAGGMAPQTIAQALAKHGRGSLCFFGAPGTGKTEFAYALADALDRELVVKQSSDLVSPYVGETEANIAALFRTCDAKRCVLLLDEVDSFLRDRRQAQRGWEVSQVNELLQQMECFGGIFIAATNLMDGLDPAALRRFDFKLHFRPLTPVQRVAMFAREVLGDTSRAEDLPKAIINRLMELDQLSAGDFANVCRQRDLLGEVMSPEDFLRRLVQECRWKSGGR